MPAVGPGTSIGGRYHLRQRLDHSPQVERWEADDTTFGREVWVTVVQGDHPGAQAALDAARRASSLTDPRLVAILDAGEEHGYVYVVEESPETRTTLGTLLHDGPLPARRARAVVLDVAEVLERARSRGLHHLALSPDMVLRRRGGAVSLRGLAVSAALAGRDTLSDEAATRADTTGLTALLHAALTATWPGAEPSTLPSTPLVAGHPAPPSELAGAVPEDLDRLVVATLAGRHDASTTPGQVIDVLKAGLEPVDVAPAPQTTTDETEVHALADDLRTDVEHPPSKAEVAAIAAAGATAAGARKVGRTMSEAARKAAERHRVRQEEHAEDAGISGPRVPLVAVLDEERSADTEPVAPVFVSDIPTGTPSARQSRFVMALMSFGVVASLLAGIFGVYAMVDNIQRQLDAPPVARTYTVSAPPATITVAPDGRVLARKDPVIPASALPPIPIVGVSAYDPEGQDKAENNSTVNNVRDGKNDTGWRSQRYKNRTFGNLKSGVGLILYVGDAGADVHQVHLVLPESDGQDIELFGADSANKDGATPIGAVKGAKGEVTIPVTGGSSKHPYVIVWFTNSPAYGGHHAAVSEITLS